MYSSDMRMGVGVYNGELVSEGAEDVICWKGMKLRRLPCRLVLLMQAVKFEKSGHVYLEFIKIY